MRVKGMVTAMLVGWAAVAIAAAPGLAAQAPQEHQHAAMEQAKAQPDLMAKCQAMMAEREKMMAEMEAADERLDDLTSKMSAASGAEKVDAIAAVVSEMVSQRRTMRGGMMMKMQEGMMGHIMMGHMMEHMQAGPDSMTMCPMMKTMKPMDVVKH